jgi:two-component system, LytTR family, response regulator
MRVLIVDDEPLGRRGIRMCLKEHADVEVIGECEDGTTALQAILGTTPDLIFLDVQMPDMNGFDVLRSVPEAQMPHVIFVTAFEAHAVRAFEVHALDYLLKPITKGRLSAALDHARKQLHQTSKVDAAHRILHMIQQEDKGYVSKFGVKTGQRILIIDAGDVDWITAAGDYAELHVQGNIHLITETMTTLEQKLDPSRFARIHRSRFINLSRVLELRTVPNGEYVVVLRDGTRLRSSRTYSRRLQEWLG